MPSTKQKLTISNRNRRISPQRWMVATAGGKKQKGLQRLPARKARFPTSRAQAAVDMPRRAAIKPTFLQNFLHSSVPTRENLWASSRVLRTRSLKVIQCFTFPPIPEELVLRKLLRLRVHKSTGDSLLCNQFLKRCAPFSGQLYHLPLQPLPDNLLLSERLETCQSHPSLQKPRLPIRSL